MKGIMFNDRYFLEDLVLRKYKRQTRRFKKSYDVGEKVAIKQSYLTLHMFPYTKIDGKCVEDLPGWRNKMFVKNELMMRAIHITNVREEKLQDITHDDCLNEGIRVDYDGEEHTYWYDDKCYGIRRFKTPQEAFASLIDRISGKGTWDSNPTVYVYDFELRYL